MPHPTISPIFCFPPGSQCSSQERLFVVLREHSQALSFEISLLDHFPDDSDCKQRH